jgi:flagellar biosynthesis/type III secretory pathway chaperone
VASLIQELIDVLEEETEVYQHLIPIANEKTRIIVQNDLDALQNITDREQEVADRVNALEHKREQVVLNIRTVLNQRMESFHLGTLIDLLGKQPEEQRKLSLLRDSLKSSVATLMEINSRNKLLIEQSLEMIEFNMNVLNSARMPVDNSIYTSSASEYHAPVPGTGMFDARQ